MKYSGLRNQIAALRAQLPGAGLRIEIRGGLVPEFGTAAAAPEPVQLELPLPKPVPSPSRARGHVFAKPGPDPTETAPRPLLGDSEPEKAPDWEQTYWRSQQHQRRKAR